MMNYQNNIGLYLRIILSACTLGAGALIYQVNTPQLDRPERIAGGENWKRYPALTGADDWQLVVYSALAGENQDLYATFSGEGGWSDAVPVTRNPGSDDRPVLVATGDQTGWLFWEAERDARWQVYGRSFRNGTWGEDITISGQSDRNHHIAAAVTDGGTVWVTWEAFVEEEWRIFARNLHEGSWSSIQRVSEGVQGCYNPAIAAGENGSIVIAWQQYDGMKYHIFLRQIRDGHWKVPLEVSEPEYPANDVHPDVVVDKEDRIWVSWDRETQVYPQRTFREKQIRASHYNEKYILIRCLDGDRWLVPPSPLEGGLQGQVTPLGWDSYSQLFVDASNRLWVFLHNSNFSIEALTYGSGEWSSRFSISERLPAWRQDASFLHVGGNVFHTAWQGYRVPTGDLVDDQANDIWYRSFRLEPASGTVSSGAGLREFSRDLYAGTQLFDGRSGMIVPREPVRNRITEWTGMATVAEAPPWTFRETTYNSRQIHRDTRPSMTLNGKIYHLYWGDLHRHTEVSRDNMWNNGSLEDHYQYGHDCEGLDFLAVTDHAFHWWTFRGSDGRDYRGTPRAERLQPGKQWRIKENAYKWYHTRQLAKFMNRDNYLTVFAGYEWTPVYMPFPHHNVIFKNDRYPNTRPKHHPNSSNPDKLWAQLRKDRDVYGGDVMTIPHATADQMAPSFWDYYDPGLSPLVELCQIRGSYEKQGGYLQPPGRHGRIMLGYVQNGLSEGQRLGFIGSGDHLGRQITGVWAEGHTREQIFEALKARRTLASYNEKILIDFRCNGRFMGEEIFCGQPVGSPVKRDLTVHVEGTAPIRELTIIRGGSRKEFAHAEVKEVHTAEDLPKNATITFSETEPLQQVDFYYVRIIQEDGEPAWGSPIWLTATP
jgi:hypothetical protein